MKQKIMGIKQGMMQIFDEQGNRVVCTVIKAESHVISQIKTKEKDGYTAIQLASIKVTPAKAKNIKKPQLGHSKKPASNLAKLCVKRASMQLTISKSVRKWASKLLVKTISSTSLVFQKVKGIKGLSSATTSPADLLLTAPDSTVMADLAG
jgi:ribosomal protein L3